MHKGIYAMAATSHDIMGSICGKNFVYLKSILIQHSFSKDAFSEGCAGTLSDERSSCSEF